jgi:hypothetical protein
MQPGSSVVRLIGRLAFIGVAETDSDSTRAQKAALTFAALCVTGLALIWVGTYLLLGLTLSAAIPFAYQVASNRYDFEGRREIEVRGKGRRRAYLLTGRRGS